MKKLRISFNVLYVALLSEFLRKKKWVIFRIGNNNNNDNSNSNNNNKLLIYSWCETK